MTAYLNGGEPREGREDGEHEGGIRRGEIQEPEGSSTLGLGVVDGEVIDSTEEREEHWGKEKRGDDVLDGVTLLFLEEGDQGLGGGKPLAGMLALHALSVEGELGLDFVQAQGVADQADVKRQHSEAKEQGGGNDALPQRQAKIDMGVWEKKERKQTT